MVFKQEVYFDPAGENRMLHIYLPRGYRYSQERYPVMYWFDGHNLFSDEDATYGTSWGLKEFLDRWDTDMIIVGIECGHKDRERLFEYSPYHLNDAFFGDLKGRGQETMEWIVHKLKPWVDSYFRTYSFREACGIAGSSMGGLMSLYAIVHYNDVFSKAACVSSTVTPCFDQLKQDIEAASLDGDTRIYLSWGSRESEGSEEKLGDDFDSMTARCNRAIAHALLESRGIVRLYRQAGGHHCEADWRKQNRRFMDFLWNDK